MSYVCIGSSTTANDADKLLAAFYLCCLSTTTLVVLIVAYGIHTGGDSCYLPNAADFFMPGPLFARAVHIPNWTGRSTFYQGPIIAWQTFLERPQANLSWQPLVIIVSLLWDHATSAIWNIKLISIPCTSSKEMHLEVTVTIGMPSLILVSMHIQFSLVCIHQVTWYRNSVWCTKFVSYPSLKWHVKGYM